MDSLQLVWGLSQLKSLKSPLENVISQPKSTYLAVTIVCLSISQFEIPYPDTFLFNKLHIYKIIRDCGSSECKREIVDIFRKSAFFAVIYWPETPTDHHIFWRLK